MHCFAILNHYLIIEEALPESVDSEDADLCNPLLVPTSWSRFSCCLEREIWGLLQKQGIQHWR